MNKRNTPLMGWASWNANRTNITTDLIKSQADLLKKLGLADVGYTYVNIDDGFFGGRDKDGNLLFHSERFPNGLKPLVDYIHSLGLKAGIYSDAGDSTCAYYYDNEGVNGKNVGLYKHEEEDLTMHFLDNDFDYLKVDWCGALRLELDEKEQYTKIGNILNRLSKEKDKDIIFNICRWQFPGDWVVDVADSWRIGSDIYPSFNSILYELDSAKPFHNYNGPGHVNDLDMLEIGNGMSKEEDESHFIMWCMMSTPLTLGNNLENISDESLKLIKNTDLISLNQDPAVIPAFVIQNVEDASGNLLGEIWLKDLGEVNSTTKAIAFLNRSNDDLEIVFDLNNTGLQGDVTYLRDLKRNQDLEPINIIKVKLKPHETEVFKVKGPSSIPVENINDLYSFIPSKINRIDLNKASELLKDNGILVDVRTPEEYNEKHLEGAINIPYSNKSDLMGKYPEDKEKNIILYCHSGKRSDQVAQILEYLGYKNIYSLGGMI